MEGLDLETGTTAIKIYSSGRALVYAAGNLDIIVTASRRRLFTRAV